MIKGGVCHCVFSFGCPWVQDNLSVLTVIIVIKNTVLMFYKYFSIVVLFLQTEVSFHNLKYQRNAQLIDIYHLFITFSPFIIVYSFKTIGHILKNTLFKIKFITYFQQNLLNLVGKKKMSCVLNCRHAKVCSTECQLSSVISLDCVTMYKNNTHTPSTCLHPGIYPVYCVRSSGY